jgi:hypothetical protein
LTDPAEAERLLREAERILDQDIPSFDALEPPGAVGGPADPVDSTNHSNDAGTADSSDSPAPMDFSQPPTPDHDSSQPSSQADYSTEGALAEPDRDAERIALRYLSHSRELTTHFQGYRESEWISPVLEEEVEPEPAVALMAAAIW